MLAVQKDKIESADQHAPAKQGRQYDLRRFALQTPIPPSEVYSVLTVFRLFSFHMDNAQRRQNRTIIFKIVPFCQFS